MMEYLRALAPHHAHARHRAVVALRSRYDIDQPIGVVPRAVAPEVEYDEREAASSCERVNQPARPLEIDGVSPSLVADDEPRPRARHKSVAAAPPRAPNASVPSHPEPETGVRTVPVENETLLHVPVTNQRPHPLPFVGSRPSERATQPVLAAVPIPRERVAEASRLAQRSRSDGPLSQLALASRVVPESDRPTVVHVTIDRVDVRAPATPDRPAPRTRSRTPTAGSLTDYLRARPAGRQGGTS
jgi:hypothetical protein